MLYVTGSISWNILGYFHIQTECGGILCGIMSIPHNTIMDLNNVMACTIV